MSNSDLVLLCGLAAALYLYSRRDQLAARGSLLEGLAPRPRDKAGKPNPLGQVAYDTPGADLTSRLNEVGKIIAGPDPAR